MSHPFKDKTDRIQSLYREVAEAEAYLKQAILARADSVTTVYVLTLTNIKDGNNVMLVHATLDGAKFAAEALAREGNNGDFSTRFGNEPYLRWREEPQKMHWLNGYWYAHDESLEWLFSIDPREVGA